MLILKLKFRISNSIDNNSTKFFKQTGPKFYGQDNKSIALCFWFKAKLKISFDCFVFKHFICCTFNPMKACYLSVI